MIRALTERIEDVIEATPILCPLGIPQARIQALANRVHRSYSRELHAVAE